VHSQTVNYLGILRIKSKHNIPKWALCPYSQLIEHRFPDGPNGTLATKLGYPGSYQSTTTSTLHNVPLTARNTTRANKTQNEITLQSNFKN
jgi:hypothetical protein